MPQTNDLFDDDENYEPEPPFWEDLHNHLAPLVKQFLINYLGDALNNAEAQTFRDIEEQIKEDVFLYGDTIPDELYRHRTIKDEREWDDAISKFKYDAAAVYPWPAVEEKWYNMPDEEQEEDDEELDLPEDAQAIVDAADKLIDGHTKFKAFMQECCAVVIPATQQYLHNTSSFDLAILSAEGYIALQRHIEYLAESLAEGLSGIVGDL